MALKDAITTVINRNVFYRDGYRILMRISMIQGLAIVLLIAAIIVMLVTMETRHIYFGTTSDGRIIRIVPLSDRYRNDADVIAWAAGTAQNVMRFDYKDFKQRLQESSTNFTPTGWDSFTRAVKDSRIVEAVEARRLVVYLEIGAAPEFKKQFVNNGVYTWFVQFPITIKFEGNEPPSPIKADLIMQIVRVSTLTNPQGIGIEQWIIKQ